MMDWINVGRMNSFGFTISNGKRHVTGLEDQVTRNGRSLNKLMPSPTEDQKNKSENHKQVVPEKAHTLPYQEKWKIGLSSVKTSLGKHLQ